MRLCSTVGFYFFPSFLFKYFLGSDMELDLLAAAETESDSESNHSNQDNASGRRSVVTAATAGSEAGMLPCPYRAFLLILRPCLCLI